MLLLLSSPRATPKPILRFVAQSRFYWILFNVCERVPEVTFVTNVTVKRLAVPKATCLPQELVTFMRSKTLPRMHDHAHLMAVVWCEKCMDVIRHNAPRMKRVTLTVEMEQRILDHFGEFFIRRAQEPYPLSRNW